MVKEFLNEQEKELNSKLKTGNQIYQTAQIDLIRAETELNAQRGKAVVLKKQLAEINGQLHALESTEKNVQMLKRDLSINEKNFQTYVDKAEEARITDDMNRLNMSNISVIQTAAVPVEPAKPKKLICIMLGLVAGLASGFGLAFARETMSQGFSTPDRLEKRFELPVLIAIAEKQG